MRIIIGVVVLAFLLCGCLFYLGSRSAKQAPPALSVGKIPICSKKPNCVSSVQDPSDEHFIEAIELANSHASSIAVAIESIGGEVIANDGMTIQATFSSGLFKFVDDLLVHIDGGKLSVRSSSRVGHGDLGANRKRVEQLRQALSE